MSYRQLPLESQTLYAELLERLRVGALRRSIGDLTGAFVLREKSRGAYWYFRTSEGPESRAVEYYVGSDNETTRALIQTYEERRGQAKEDHTRMTRLTAMLREGDLVITETATAKIIKGLGAAGIFAMGGVLVGTHAFVTLGNALGVRWESALHTQDVDFAAHPREIELGVPADSKLTANIPAAIESLQMGFLPHVTPHSSTKPTAYVVHNEATRIDLLTYPRGKDRTSPVEIPRLGTHAEPVEFMDYLIEKPMDGVILNGGATLVRIPTPARFALHKLLVAGNRDVRYQVKAAKDRLQAHQVLEYLEQERPGDIGLAAEDLCSRGPGWVKRLRVQAAKLPRVFDELEDVLRGV